MTSKRTILTQQMLRIMLNCSQHLQWAETAKHLTEMNKRLQYSGYNKKFRTEITKSALNAYNKLLEDDRNGTRPLYRPRAWKRSERNREKQKKKTKWYKRNDYDSVLFIQATPNSILKKECQKVIKRSGVKIKVIEKSGETLKRKLQKSDSFKSTKCRENECFVCDSDGNGKCKEQGITYEIICESCEGVYIGETARTAKLRGNEHWKQYKERKEGSVLWKHCKEVHEQQEQKFKINVKSIHHNNAMERQISEAVNIKNSIQASKILMNNKSEWNQANVPTVTICRN